MHKAGMRYYRKRKKKNRLHELLEKNLVNNRECQLVETFE
jgi:hypothetical protein